MQTQQHVHVLEEKVHHEHAHVHFSADSQVLGYPEVIHETSEEHLNDSSMLSKNSKLSQMVRAEHLEEHYKLTLIDQFQHIDNQELEKLGVTSKNELTEDAIPELHQFTMLQRFRQGRDFTLPEKTSA